MESDCAAEYLQTFTVRQRWSPCDGHPALTCMANTPSSCEDSFFIWSAKTCASSKIEESSAQHCPQHRSAQATTKLQAANLPQAQCKPGFGNFVRCGGNRAKYTVRSSTHFAMVACLALKVYESKPLQTKRKTWSGPGSRSLLPKLWFPEISANASLDFWPYHQRIALIVTRIKRRSELQRFILI